VRLFAFRSSVIEELLQETIGDQTNSSFSDYDKSMAEMRRATQVWTFSVPESFSSIFFVFKEVRIPPDLTFYPLS
jgi:hypothetical protein